MRNDAYWANRMKILEESLLDTGYEYAQNLERQYTAAIQEVEKQMASWYQRFAVNNEITLAEAQKMLTSSELEEFKWTVADYIAKGQEHAASGNWMKQLENASARVHVSRLDSLKIQLQQQAEALSGTTSEALNSSLTDIYSRGYYRTAFELQKGTGVGWSLHGLTDTQIKKVLSQPWTLDKQTFSDRIWSNKQQLVNSVNTNLTQMIMRGQAPDKAIKAISERFNVSKSQAGRLVMTESAAFANSARQDCFNELGVERYDIVESLDSETCDLCASLDGKVYPMSAYAVGVTAPPFHPWCRGTTAPYYEDMVGLGDRAARDGDGKTYAVPKDMTYKSWEAYNKAISQEPLVTANVRAAVAKAGGELYGEEFRLKTPESFSRKINSDAADLVKLQGLTRADAISYAAEHTYDAVRYTSLSKSTDFLSNYNKTVYNLKRSGYNISRVKNSMPNLNAAYRGVNTVVTAPSGYRFELQFHTPESMKLKDMVHPLYEELRLDTTPLSRKNELDAQMQALSRKLKAPMGSDEIIPFDDLR